MALPPADEIVRTYRELAEAYDRQGEAPLRDRFLVLAADAAQSAGRTEEAGRLRGRLLSYNPHHLLKPFASFAEAMQSTDVQNYVTALRRNHSYEKAVELLATMRREASREHKEESRVFRLVNPHEEEERARSRIPSTPAPKGGPAVPSASRFQALGPRAPVTRPGRPTADIYAIRPDPDLDGSPISAEPRAGAWVCSGLFLLTLVAGLALSVETFARPFLPRAWWP
jgi:hypothetical protein